jgi:hypothetical protein
LVRLQIKSHNPKKGDNKHKKEGGMKRRKNQIKKEEIIIKH